MKALADAMAEDEETHELQSTTRQIIIKGERQSSVGFVTALVQGNYPERYPAACSAAKPEPTPTTYCCWSHGYASSKCSGFNATDPFPLHVFVLRSPYPWALAMHAHENGGGSKNASFSEFIRSKFTYEPAEYPGRPEMHANPIKMLMAKYRSYLTFARSGKAPSLNVTVEQLYTLNQARSALGLLAETFGPTLVREDGLLWYPAWQNPKKTSQSHAAKEINVTQLWSTKAFMDAKEYEVHGLWKELLSPEDLDFITSQLDDEVMKAFRLEKVRYTAKKKTLANVFHPEKAAVRAMACEGTDVSMCGHETKAMAKERQASMKTADHETHLFNNNQHSVYLDYLDTSAMEIQVMTAEDATPEAGLSVGMIIAIVVASIIVAFVVLILVAIASKSHGKDLGKDGPPPAAAPAPTPAMAPTGSD
jgi:hypothetical protein